MAETFPYECLMEIVRRGEMVQLRKSFDRKCGQISNLKRAPNESFNAWLFAALAEPDFPLVTEEKEHLFVSISEEAPTVSPLCKYLERSHAELLDSHRNEETHLSDVDVISNELEKLLRHDFLRARKNILEKWPTVVRDFLGERSYAAKVERTCPKEGRIKYTLILPTQELTRELEGFVVRQPLSYEILEEYDKRLRERYTRGQTGITEDSSSIDVTERIWLLLHRYNTLFGTKSGEGRGWQLGTPTDAMKLMEGQYGVSHECFASPLNATLSSFCSLFYDTDRFFGSVGSFFRLPLGSFPEACEIGPPYEPGLMLKAVRKVEKILAHACKTFVFVVPDWENCECIDAIKQSKYNIGSVSLKKEEHRYKNGFQHMVLKYSLKHSMCETPTLIAWLSSSKSVHVSQDDKDEMKRSWCPVS